MDQLDKRKKGVTKFGKCRSVCSIPISAPYIDSLKKAFLQFENKSSDQLLTRAFLPPSSQREVKGLSELLFCLLFFMLMLLLFGIFLN